MSGSPDFQDFQDHSNLNPVLEVNVVPPISGETIAEFSPGQLFADQNNEDVERLPIPGLVLDDGDSDRGSVTGSHRSESPPSDTDHEIQVAYPNDDPEWPGDTKEQIESEEFINLKKGLGFNRESADVFETNAEQQRPHFKNKRMEKIRQDMEKLTLAQQRGKLRPPTLAHQNSHYLYDNIVDRLRECTVHITLRRTWQFYMLYDYVEAENCAMEALNAAKILDYKPLEALCHFNIGKAQSKQKKYNDAVTSFQNAQPAIGLYVEGSQLAERERRAEADALAKVNYESEPTYPAVTGISERSVDSQASDSRSSSARSD